MILAQKQSLVRVHAEFGVEETRPRKYPTAIVEYGKVRFFIAAVAGLEIKSGNFIAGVKFQTDRENMHLRITKGDC